MSSLFSNTTGGDRHRETQLQLQRKLQERELVREQKRKLQQQKEENEQQIRMSLDRQTPVIFSPSLQQDSSPARRIFDDENARNAQNEVLDCQRSKSVVCIGSMSPPLPRSQRSKSLVGDVEMKMVASSNRMDKTETMDTAITNKSMETASSNQVSCVQAINNRLSSTEEITCMEFGQNARTPKKSEKSDRLEHNVEASSPFHTVRKPSFVVLGSVNIPNKEIVPSSNHLTVVNSSPINSHHSVFVAESSNKDTNLNVCTENKNMLVSDSLIKDCNNKDNSLFINPSTIPSRSAFVPFSQVQCRKDVSDDTITKIPSMSVTSGADVIDSSNLNSIQQTLLLGNQLDSNEQTKLPSTNIYSESSPGRPILVMKTVPSSASVGESQVVLEANNNNITCKPITCDTNLTADQLKQSPSMTLPTFGLVGKQDSIINATTPCSESQFSQPLTSPSKKAPRSRFTPIRPKASPTKTVSSILKEQKVLNSDAPAYDTRPVATLLKEKRAREAEAMSNKSKPVTQTISLTPTLPPSVVGNFSNVSNNLNLSTLPAGKPGEFVIILNTNPFNQNALPSTSQNMVSAVTTTTLSVTTSTCKSSVQTHTVSSLAQKTGRTRTNSSSERELDSPMPMSQDSLNTSDLSEGYTSATDEEKPSKMAKIIDSDQNVSSRPGSRCSPDRETPSFSGRKRKFYNVGGNSQSRKRINSVDDDDDDVIICDPKEFMKDQRRTRSCTFETDEIGTTTKNSEFNSKDGSQCPDISSLESDALLDISDNVYLLSTKSNTKDSLTKQVHSTAVGVNALSLRQSQQQLLKQKQMLDERMKFFLQKDSDGWISNTGQDSNQVSHKRNDHLTEKQDMSLRFEQQNIKFKESPIENQENFENLSSSEMDVGEDIPPDVVDFITEKLTGISNTNVNIPEKQINTFEENVTRPRSDEMIVEVDFSETQMKISQYSQSKEVDMVHLNQDLGPNNSNVQLLHKNNRNELNDHLQISSKLKTSADPMLSNNGQVIKPGLFGHLESSQSRTDTQSASNQMDTFVSPQTPVRRQRTSSVEKGVGHTQQTFQRPRETSTEVNHGKRTPSSDGGYSMNPTQHAFHRPRESSFDSHGKQTPSSDAGYYSIGSSPVSHSTPVSGALTCENHALLTRNPSSLMVTRPDSAQSLSSDIIVPQSPIQQLSPRFHTSTPLLLRSPCPTPNQGCPTPNQGMLPSPTDVSGPHGQITEFMPIQGSSLKINSHVTLIKPVVTLASSQVQGQGHIAQDLIGIGSIQPDLKESSESRALPSYNAALQSKQRERMQSNIGKKGAFDTFKEAKLPTYVSTSSVVGNEGDVQKKVEKKTSSDISNVVSKSESSPLQNLLPFSNYMALLSRKAQEDQRSSKEEKGKQSEILNDSNGNIFIETDIHHQKVTNSVTVLPERGTVNWTGINKLSAEAKSKASSHLSQDKPNIESILSLLKSYENLSSSKTSAETTIPSNISTSFTSTMHFTSLPSSNYSGKAPNINLATILPTAKDKVINSETKTVPAVIDNDDVTFTARRNLTDLLSEQTNDIINEDELQSTLDVLRSVDSQYFGQDDLEFDFSKRV